VDDLCQVKNTYGTVSEALCRATCTLNSATSVGRCNANNNCTCIEDTLCSSSTDGLQKCAMYCKKKNGNKAVEATCDSGSCTCSGVSMPLADPCDDSESLCQDMCRIFGGYRGGHCSSNKCQCVQASNYCSSSSSGVEKCTEFCFQNQMTNGYCDDLDQCVCGSGSIAVAAVGLTPVFTIALYLFVQLFGFSNC